MDWIKQWIKEVLTDIPDSGYRRRLEAELHDHLETQCRALTESGRAEAEARAEALCAMGNPEKLREEYKTAWRNTLEARALGAVGWFGATILCGIVSYAAFGLTYSAIFVVSSFTGIYEWDNVVYRLLCGPLVFWFPHIIEVLLLREFLSHYRHRKAAITVSLLANWAFGICFLINWRAADARVPLPIGPELLSWWFYNRLPDHKFFWITPLYLVMSVLGCILLGQFFGRISLGKRQTAVS